MAGFGGIRKGRREAVENLGFEEGGDCPRCGGESELSSMTGYLRCVKCSHEWPDPDYVEVKDIQFTGLSPNLRENNIKNKLDSTSE